jgi:hypothetical protein
MVSTVARTMVSLTNLQGYSKDNCVIMHTRSCCPYPNCCLPPSLLSPLPSLLLLSLLAHHPCCRCHCPRGCRHCHLPATLVPVAIALPPLPSLLPSTLFAVSIAPSTFTIALFVARHPHCHHHCPRCCRRRHHCTACHCHCLPATLVAIALAAIAIALFDTRHPHCQRHLPVCCLCPLCHPPPLSPSPLPCHPCSLCCCPHHPPHALVICRRPPSWLCGHQCSLACHLPPLKLPLLVNCCYSTLFAPPIQRTVDSSDIAGALSFNALTFSATNTATPRTTLGVGSDGIAFAKDSSTCR